MPASPAPPAAPVAAPKAPAPKAAPAPVSEAPKLTGAQIENKFANEAFADLDALDAGKQPPKPQPKKESAKADPTDADGAETPSETSTTETDSEEQKSASDATDATKPTSEQKPQKAKELREAYESVKKWKQENEPKLKKLPELEAKLKELESKNPELEKTFKAKIEANEKRIQELESDLRLAAYQKHPEYKKHQENLSETWDNARQKLSGIKLSVGEDAQGNKIERPITMERIAEYARTDPAERWNILRNEIPDPAERTAVINHIEKIIDVHKAAEKAEAKATEDAALHSKTQAEQQAQLHQTRTKLWRESNEALAKQFPHWFSKADGDDEGNTIFNRGAALADLAMFPQELTDEMIDLLPKSVKENISSKKPFTEQQVQKLRSIVRNKAANHDRLVHQNKTLKKELAEAKKALKEFEDSSPDGVQARQPTGKNGNGITDYNVELDALEKKHSNR